jgi:hypothetical protein
MHKRTVNTQTHDYNGTYGLSRYASTSIGGGESSDTVVTTVSEALVGYNGLTTHATKTYHGQKAVEVFLQEDLHMQAQLNSRAERVLFDNVKALTSSWRWRLSTKKKRARALAELF